MVQHILRINEISDGLYKVLSYTNTDIDRTILKELNHFITSLVKNYLISRSNRVLPRVKNIDLELMLVNIANTYKLEHTLLVSVIDDFTAIDFLIDIINSLVPINTFDMWVVSIHMNMVYIENLGDWRILEWERDHIVRGVYVG